MDVTPENMSTVGAREAKNRLGAYLKQVREGAEIIITRRGRPIARLTGVGAEQDEIAQLIEDGAIRPAAAAAGGARRRRPTSAKRTAKRTAKRATKAPGQQPS